MSSINCIYLPPFSDCCRFHLTPFFGNFQLHILFSKSQFKLSISVIKKKVSSSAVLLLNDNKSSHIKISVYQHKGFRNI